MTSFRDALSLDRPLILDGAIGTELAARGFSTDRPGWSAAATFEAPELLIDIYREYIEAGADIVTANTFRMHLSACGTLGRNQRDAVCESVRLVRAANPRFVIGSVGTVADCYLPDLAPNDGELRRQHMSIAEALGEAEPDAVILETMNTFREARIAVECLNTTGLTVIASLWSADRRELGDGITLLDAAMRLTDLGAAAVCVNCLAAEDIQPVLDGWAGRVDRFGAYGNTGKRVEDGWESTAAENPAVYADYAANWISAGAALVGGCCMTRPAHILEIRKRVDAMAFKSVNP